MHLYLKFKEYFEKYKFQNVDQFDLWNSLYEVNYYNINSGNLNLDFIFKI